MCREDLGGSSQIKPAKKMTPVFGTEGQEFQTAEGIFVSFPVTSEHGFPGSFTCTDYVFVSEKTEPSIKTESDFPVIETGNLLTCGCRESYLCKVNRREDHSRCLQTLLGQGRLWFRCGVCSATTQSLGDLHTHVRQAHADLEAPPRGLIKCGTCTKAFQDPESAQQHFHRKHCSLRGQVGARLSAEPKSPPPTRAERKPRQTADGLQTAEPDRAAETELSGQSAGEAGNQP